MAFGAIRQNPNDLRRRVGIGVNLIKNPDLINYPTTNLSKLLNKKISKNKIEKQLKKIFEIKLTELYK